MAYGAGRRTEWIVRAPALSEDWSVHLQTLGHPSAVGAVAVSRDGRFILSGSADRTVRMWDAATGAERVLRVEGLNERPASNDAVVHRPALGLWRRLAA